MKPQTIRDSQDSRFVKICLFGEPGVGKTRLIGGSPGRLLIIRPPTDHTDSLAAADKARAEEAIINDWNEMNELRDYLRHDGGKDFDWVWLDSISLIQDHLLDDIWETVIIEKPARARYGLDQAEYGINMLRLGIWLRSVIGVDAFNFGFTGHPARLSTVQVSKEGQDPQAEPKLMPWIQGKNMPAKFCGYTNQVLFMETAKIGGVDDRRVIRTGLNERYYAKDQFDMASNGRMLDPTMPKIIAAIEKSRGRKLGVDPPRRKRSGAATKVTTTKARPRRVVRGGK